MAMSSLRSMLRTATRGAGAFPSSPGTSRNALFSNVDGRSVLDAVPLLPSGFVGSRGMHSRAQLRSWRRPPPVPAAVTRRRRRRRRQQGTPLGSTAAGRGRGGRRSHASKDELADRVFAAVTVAASAAFAGVWYWMRKPDQHPQAAALIPDEYSAMVDDDKEEDDSAMRARFADWMQRYGRTYWDEDDKAKARSFETFKSSARSVDEGNALAAEVGIPVRCRLTQFADSNAPELANLGYCCEFLDQDWPPAPPRRA